MKISVAITAEELETLPVAAAPADCGAHAVFFGVVRSEEAGRTIKGLDYEAYSPMAEQEMERIIRDLARSFPCEQVNVVHRIGQVPAGKAAIIVRVYAKHRAEAFGLMTALLDRLKQDVPIWKAAAIAE